MGEITDTRDEIEAKAKQLKGDVKKTVGDLADDKQLQAEGELDRLRGKAEEKIVEGKRELRRLDNP